MRLAFTGLVLSGMLTACDLDTALVVESDTAWSGTVDRHGQVSGRGHARYDLTAGDGSRVCWVLTKQSSAGTLRAYTEEESALGGTDIRNVRVTTAPGGTVEGCTE